MDCTPAQAKELTLAQNTNSMQSLIDAIPIPIFSKDPNGVYQVCNQAFAALFGTVPERILGKTVHEFSETGDGALWDQMDQEQLLSGGSLAYTGSIGNGSGEEKVYRFHQGVRCDDQGRPEGIAGAISDITAYTDTITRGNRLALLKEAMLEVSHSIIGLRDTRDLLELLLDKALSTIPSSHAGSVLMIDEAGYLKMLVSRGYRSEGVESFKLKVEETFTYRVSGGRFEEPFIVNHIAEMVEDGCLKPLLTQDGRHIASNLSTPIRVEGEAVALVIVDSFENEVFTEDDVELMSYLKAQAELALTNLKLYQDTLRLSRYDHLTGIYNRGYFDRVLGDFIAEAQERPRAFTFVIMDLDGLKVVNDRFGHREGDFRLQAFTHMISAVLGKEDIVGRYGGDEFVAVFFGKTEEEVHCLVKGVMEKLGKEPELHCSFSFGTARYPEDGNSHEELVRVADRKLYAHKRTKNFGRRREDHGNNNQ